MTVNVLLPGGPADTRMIPSGHGADRSGLVRPEVMVPPLLLLLSHAQDLVTGAASARACGIRSSRLPKRLPKRAHPPPGERAML